MADDEAPTYDAKAVTDEMVLRKLRRDIGMLDRDAEQATVAKIVGRVADAELSPLETERLLKTIHQQTGAGMVTLRQQLASARFAENNEILDLRLAALNEEFAVVKDGGRTMIAHWRHDPVLDRDELERLTFTDFRNLQLNNNVGRTNAAEVWLANPKRRQYLGGVVFDPTGQAPASCLNLWRGFAVDPAPGDWRLMQGHLRDVICSGDAGNFDYLLNWLARLVQHPERQGEVAVVMRGGKGAGKGIFGRWLCRLFGQHGWQITNPEHLVGKHNEHLRDCVVLFADEAFYAGDKRHEGVLKGLVTEDTLTIDPKFFKPFTTRNLLHIVMASNDDWVIPASADERRFFVLDVAGTHQGDLDYFAAIEQQMQEGGLAAILHDLLACDLAAFNVRDVPQTSGLRAQKTLSLNSVASWWLAVLERGVLYRSRHGCSWFDTWHDFYATALLLASYLQWCDDRRVWHRASDAEIGRFLAGMYGFAKRPRTLGPQPTGEIENYDRELVRNGRSLDDVAMRWTDRPRGYVVGNLDQARHDFIVKYDVAAEWERDEETAVGTPAKRPG